MTRGLHSMVEGKCTFLGGERGVVSQHAQWARTSKRRCDSAAIDVLEARPRRRTCRQEAKGGQAGLGGMAVPCPYSSAARVRTRTSRCRWSSGGRMTESRATRVAASIVFLVGKMSNRVGRAAPQCQQTAPKMELSWTGTGAAASCPRYQAIHATAERLPGEAAGQLSLQQLRSCPPQQLLSCTPQLSS